MTDLIDAGLNVCRFNFSHGDHSAHQECLERVRKATANRPDRNIAILLDTKGPEIRTGNFVKDKAKMNLKAGQDLILTSDYSYEATDDTKLAITYEKMATTVKPGDSILCADGTLVLSVKECYPDKKEVRFGERARIAMTRRPLAPPREPPRPLTAPSPADPFALHRLEDLHHPQTPRWQVLVKVMNDQSIGAAVCNQWPHDTPARFAALIVSTAQRRSTWPVSPVEHSLRDTLPPRLSGMKKNMNLPGVKVELPVLQDKDINDLQNFAVPNKVDFIAASFVQCADDIHYIREILGEGGKDIKIISKIENQEGLINFDSILEVTDGVMVARGDLGMEIPPEQVFPRPLHPFSSPRPSLPHARPPPAPPPSAPRPYPQVFKEQKMMVEKCRAVGKPCLVATQVHQRDPTLRIDSTLRRHRTPTPSRHAPHPSPPTPHCGVVAIQMLESMIMNPRPTRAECGDVANAVLDGCDSVMLSGETANGAFPRDAVGIMARSASPLRIPLLPKEHVPAQAAS